MLNRYGEDRMAAATKSVKRKTDPAVAKERRRPNQTAKSEEKFWTRGRSFAGRLLERTFPRGCQEILVVVIEERIAPRSEIDTAALSVHIQLMQVIDVVGSQRSTGGGRVRQEEKVEDIEAEPGLVGKKHAAVAEAVCMAAQDMMSNDLLL